MEKTHFIGNKILLLSDERKAQILDQAETALRLMQGKISLAESKSVLGNIYGQDNTKLSFDILFMPDTNYAYSSLDVSLLGMSQETYTANPDLVEHYLREASFRLKPIDGISKDEVVARLNLPLRTEEYLDFPIGEGELARPYYRYTYTIPRNAKIPYKVLVELYFYNQGKLVHTDNKGQRSFDGVTDLKSINILRVK